MELFGSSTNSKRKPRQPDHLQAVSRFIGVAVWRQHATGDHDIKLGELQSLEGSIEPLVRSTTPLSKLRELVLGIGGVAGYFAKDRSVPDEVRDELEALADSIEAMFPLTRHDGSRNADSTHGKSNGVSA